MRFWRSEADRVSALAPLPMVARPGEAFALRGGRQWERNLVKVRGTLCARRASGGG
jgi:hypothetical protein